MELGPTFKQLLKVLQQVPYLASKNIYRVATYFLSLDQERAQQFCQAILSAKENIEPCNVCYVWKEKTGECLFCADPKRDTTVLCVLETWHELQAIERTHGFNGLYHVLGGAICPLEGIGPEQLTIEPLLNRLDGSIKEVILATNQTPEGEATAAFISHKIARKVSIITCLARGVPIGSSLEYMDRITIYKALSERRPF